MVSHLTKIFIFFFIFTIDVRVRAENIIQQPLGCVEHSQKCAVMSKEKSFTFKVGDNLVTLGKGATVIRVSDHEILLAMGAIFVRAKGEFIVNTPQGNFSWSAGEALIERTAESVAGTGLSVDLNLAPRGHKETYLLPIGFSNWIKPVGLNGQASIGIPQTANLTWIIETWGGLYEGRAETLKKEIEEYKVFWQRALVATASWHKEMIQRRIAEVESERARRARLKAQKEAEDAKLRAIFRERNYIR